MWPRRSSSPRCAVGETSAANTSTMPPAKLSCLASGTGLPWALRVLALSA